MATISRFSFNDTREQEILARRPELHAAIDIYMATEPWDIRHAEAEKTIKHIQRLNRKTLGIQGWND